MAPTSLNGPEISSASGRTKKLVIYLHGLGSNGDDLIALADMMPLPDTHYMSPNAPFPFDMAPFGYQWFSLYGTNAPSRLEGARMAAPILDTFIDAQIARFQLMPGDVALVGFSQGTMMAFHTALRRPQPLAAVVGFSGMLIAPELLAEEIKSRPPLCLIHGMDDEVVPFAAMAQAEEALKAADVNIETHARPRLGHSIDEAGLMAATAFLQKHLARQPQET